MDEASRTQRLLAALREVGMGALQVWQSLSEVHFPPSVQRFDWQYQPLVGSEPPCTRS